MKQLLLAFLVALSHLIGCAQNDSLAMIPDNSITVRTSELVNELVILKLKDNKANRYKIYPTENIYILIKLDTQTGRLELIQWSLNTDKEFSATLNGDDLSIHDGLNSFELYPTQNMYQFILLDKATGRNWHVQWGTKSSDIWIRRIY
ncbi:MAG: hypothetical protein K2H59_00200 [Muribaculaceae bacterium]|nr:hypothetical protein [Muribaculaceae bacterium]